MAALHASTRDDWFSLENRGWTLHAEDAGPKTLALASLANLAAPDPVASVSYVSHGNLLVVAGSELARARRCAEGLAGDLHVTLLGAERGATPVEFIEWTGRLASLTGYLGEFQAQLADLQVEPGAALRVASDAKFDLVLDFSPVPAFTMHAPPQGYFRAPAGDADLEMLLTELRESVGEFEKPRYFAYRESLCAHQRSEIVGCNKCIDVCSTRAIAPAGDQVEVDPHLCMGCGACSTVCPSGAMSYQFPRPADRGAQMKQLLSTYRHAGGQDACLLFHDGTDGRELLANSASPQRDGAARGVPARVIPIETWHVASIGIDLLLPAIAFGASQVAILMTGREAPEYRAALREQMAIGQSILSALGYGGTHFVLVEAETSEIVSAALEALRPATGIATPAAFLLANDKRTAVEFAVEHLARQAPAPRDEIGLPQGAPYGEVVVDKQKCTLCLACAGACPASALMDGGDMPLLKFLERNCVQCGLCESTCPEAAITLKPRLLLTPAVREARVLNETQPFHCLSCHKAFGTQQMVATMLTRLAGHSMFATPEAQRRLQLCADCRVVDMMSNPSEASILR